jgi:hypothetical protein
MREGEKAVAVSYIRHSTARVSECISCKVPNLKSDIVAKRKRCTAQKMLSAKDENYERKGQSLCQSKSKKNSDIQGHVPSTRTRTWLL